MRKIGKTTAVKALRLRDSPRDGVTLKELPTGTRVEIMGEETWLRVKAEGMQGFVLSDYVELFGEEELPNTSTVNIITYKDSRNIWLGEPLQVDQEFTIYLEIIEKLAIQNNLQIWVTSSLREPYKPVSDAIVDPARFSNHHIGHGIDINLISNKVNWYNSSRMLDIGTGSSAPGDPYDSNVYHFIKDLLKHRPLRWGGEFTTPDPVHIDDGFNQNLKEDFNKKLFALWGRQYLNNTA